MQAAKLRVDETSAEHARLRHVPSFEALASKRISEPNSFPPPEVSETAPSTRERKSVVRQEWAPALLFLVLDVIAWLGLYTATAYARGNVSLVTPLQWIALEVISLSVVVVALWVVGGYNPNTKTRTLSYATEHVLALITAAAFASLLIYSAATYDQTMKPSRGVLLMSFLLFIPISLGYRQLANRFIAVSTASRAFIVLGSGELAANFYRAYRKSQNAQRLEFISLDPARVGEHICGPGSPILEGDIATKLSRLGQNYSGVIVAEQVGQISPDLLQRLVRTQFQATRVYTLESFYEAHWRHVPIESLDPFWPLQMGFQLAQSSPYHYLKRISDIVIAAFALLLCAPLIAVTTALIWSLNGQPALFRQPRVGREGDVFTILKFRTMHNREASVADDLYTRDGDPRVTALGRWLRKSRLDELPQLWNVLRGEMSLIGPRAEWTKCSERYEKKIPFYHFRHLVKPGITGWAQVNYPYGESDEDAIEKLKYDLYYIRHYSIKLDAMIVLKTAHTMLFGKGR